nr:hypothetical protein [Tanacetum cinerariifolium]
MINSIKNGDQPLPRVTQVSSAGTSSTEQPPLKDKSMWSDQEKRIQKLDRLARSLLIQGLSNYIYSLIDSNKTTKDLWDALTRHMLGSEYGKQDRKATVLYEYETFKATEGELLLFTYIRYLQNKNLMNINIDALYNILKQNQGHVNDAMGSKKKTVVVTSDPLALIAKKIKVSKSKEKVVVSSDSKGSEDDNFSELKKITALLAKDFNRGKFYPKPTNNNLRTSSTSQSANKKQEFAKNDNKKVKKKDDEKKKKIANQEVLYDKMSVQLVELEKHVRDLKNTVLEKDFKISELEESVRNKDQEMEKCLERLNCVNHLERSCLRILNKWYQSLVRSFDLQKNKISSTAEEENDEEKLKSDQVKEGVGYNGVPPAAADLYRSPKKDLSWTGLPEFADDTVTDYSRPTPTVESTSAEGQNKHSTTAENGESTDSILSKPAVKFVKA